MTKKQLVTLASITMMTLIGVAQVARADEATGTITGIESAFDTFQLNDDGHLYQWSSENSLGVPLKDLKKGDEVTVIYLQEQEEDKRTVQDIRKAE